MITPNNQQLRNSSHICPSQTYFRLVSERGHIRFRWFHTCAEVSEPPFLFLLFCFVHFFFCQFNYCSHLLMTGWPTTSALTWFTPVNFLYVYSLSLSLSLSLCFFFLLFFSLSFPKILYNLDLPYHVIFDLFCNPAIKFIWNCGGIIEEYNSFDTSSPYHTPCWSEAVEYANHTSAEG